MYDGFIIKMYRCVYMLPMSLLYHILKKKNNTMKLQSLRKLSHFKNVSFGSVVFIFLLSGMGKLYAENYVNATMADCIQIALQNNINIKIALEDVQSASSALKITKGSNDIQVSGTLQTVEILKAEAAQTKFNIPGRDTLIGLFVGASASYKLYDANKSNHERLRLLEYNMAALSALRVTNNVVRDVKIAYYRLLFAKTRSELLAKLVGSFEIKYANVMQLFKNGQRTMMDVSRAQVDLTNAQLNYQRALNELSIAKSTLMSLMGMHIEQFDIQISGYGEKRNYEMPYTLDELIELAKLHSFDLKSAEINKEIAKTYIEIEKDRRLPVINIMASLGFENRAIQNGAIAQSLSDRNNWEPTMHAGVNANFPIYTSGVVSSSIDRASVSYNKALYHAKINVDNLTAAIKSYYNTLHDLKMQLEISKQLIDNARKYLDLVQKNYDRGIVTQNELQDAELNYINVSIDYIKIFTDYHIDFNHLISIVNIDENIFLSRGENAQ